MGRKQSGQVHTVATDRKTGDDLESNVENSTLSDKEKIVILVDEVMRLRRTNNQLRDTIIGLLSISEQAIKRGV